VAIHHGVNGVAGTDPRCGKDGTTNRVVVAATCGGNGSSQPPHISWGDQYTVTVELFGDPSDGARYHWNATERGLGDHTGQRFALTRQDQCVSLSVVRGQINAVHLSDEGDTILDTESGRQPTQLRRLGVIVIDKIEADRDIWTETRYGAEQHVDVLYRQELTDEQ